MGSPVWGFLFKYFLFIYSRDLATLNPAKPLPQTLNILVLQDLEFGVLSSPLYLPLQQLNSIKLFGLPYLV